MPADARRNFEQELRAYVGVEDMEPEIGPDPVNEPMIRQWCEIMGDENPVHTDREFAARSGLGGIVAPPTMLQVWIMRGYAAYWPRASSVPTSPQRRLGALLDAHGYRSVVATDCVQEYLQVLRPGDTVSATSRIDSISEEKTTALGRGYFFDTVTTIRNQRDEIVGRMRFRLFKFRAAERPEGSTAATH
jgi:acyl dehydratase